MHVKLKAYVSLGSILKCLRPKEKSGWKCHTHVDSI